MPAWIDAVIRKPRLSTIWIRALEPLLRFWPGYPPDWELRRMLVFERARGCCESCRSPVGDIRLLDDGWRVGGGVHVHHYKPISRGGRHGLGNLRLLCGRCHARQHPGNVWLQRWLHFR